MRLGLWVLPKLALALLLIKGSVSVQAALVVPPSLAERVCSSLGTRANWLGSKTRTKERAAQIFLEKLEPSLRKNVRSPMDVSDFTEPKIHRTLQKAYEAALYSAASERAVPGYEISPGIVQDRVLQLAALMSRKIDRSANIPTAERKSMIDSLRQIKVFTYESLDRERDLHQRQWASAALDEACGRGLVNATAVAVVGELSSPGMLVCPALAVSVAGLGYERAAFDFILAHELGHIVSRAGQNTADEKLRTCWKRRYGAQFRSLDDVVALLDPIYRAQVARSTSALFDSQQGNYIRQARWLKDDLTRRLGHAPEPIDTHVFEAVGDYWATRVTAPLTARLPGTNVEQSVAASLGLFCDQLMTGTEAPLDGDEGVHPGYLFRIENFMRHPALSKPLGVSAPLGPWCDL